VKKVSLGRPENSARTVICTVAEVHQKALLAATDDVAARLQDAGYAIIGAVVPEPGSLSAHDLVLDYRKPPRSKGKYACDLKLRTEPAMRNAMRTDSAAVFATACRNDKRWLGQVIIVAEVSKDGEFLRSKAELLMRGRRGEPVNLWGWGGRPALAPPPPRRVPPPPAPVMPPPTPAPTLVPWAVVSAALDTYDAFWTSEDVAKLKDFYLEAGLKHKAPHASRTIKENPMRWIENVHYGHAITRSQGRNKQGGGVHPLMVKLSALKKYHRHLVVHGA
jgi:hypothetical protein